MSAHFWTDAERALVASSLGNARQLDWAECERIGAAIGRSVHAVRHAAKKIGVSRRRCRAWTGAELRQLRKDYADRSIPIARLVEKYGRTRQAILIQAHNHGWERRARSLTPEKVALLARLYGRPDAPHVADLARRLGCSIALLRMTRLKLGLKRHPEFIRRQNAKAGAKGNQARAERRMRGMFKDDAREAARSAHATPIRMTPSGFMGSAVGSSAAMAVRG